MIFPFAYLALTSSLTAILIAAGLAGRSELAAELAVIQGALLATFYAFSANTRSLILQGHSDLTPDRLLAKRFIALPFMGGAAYLLCVAAAGVSPLLALLLIARRACEWLAEVRLCESEVAAERAVARRVVGVQVSVTLAVSLVLAFLPEWADAALAVFAVAPLVPSTPRPSIAAFRVSTLGLTLRSASPYIGSTTIEGVSTYALRLVVFLVAGRDMAGMLFTAYVMGGFAATLFANVLGPTLALSRTRSTAGQHGALVLIAALSMAAMGAALASAALASGLANWLSRPGYFWLALGLSLLGAAIMIAAQWIRLRLFDERRGQLLFGPDVLRSITAIIAAPVLYYLVSPAALGALYLLTALLTAFGYWGAAVRRQSGEPSNIPQFVLAAAILLPLFVMLNGSLYHSPGAPVIDPGGGVMSVPLPMSLLACFVGLLLLARYAQATLSLTALYFLFIAMVLTTVLAAEGHISDDLRKFVLLFQFLVPAFALVLGEMCGSSPRAMRAAAAGFLAVLAVVVPLQLTRSIGSVDAGLSHDLGSFSVYQHLEYVPAVLACAFLFALLALWEHALSRRVLVILAPLLAYYFASARSLPAVVLLAVGILALLALRRQDRAARLCALLTVIALFAHSSQPGSSLPLETAGSRPAHGLFHYWALFASGIAESIQTALFGHSRVMDRNLAPSAYNYYLDFVYNFGLIAFLPFAWLVVHTAVRLWREWRMLVQDPGMIALVVVFVFVLMVESLLKVPLRQPYSGIAYFFLWGLLLAGLSRHRAE